MLEAKVIVHVLAMIMAGCDPTTFIAKIGQKADGDGRRQV